MDKGPNTVICTYRVRAETEEEFVALLKRHWPTLSAAGLVTGEPARAWRGVDAEGRPFYTEVFTWKDSESPGIAHGHPEVGKIWGPMEPLTEERDGRPRWEFPHVTPVDLG